MKEIIVLYLAGVITKRDFINCTIEYYEIYQKEKWTKHIEEILERRNYWEFIHNEMENTYSPYTLPLNNL